MKKVTAVAQALAVGFSPSFAFPAHSQIARPEPIETEIREEWRAPFSQFLRDLGAADVDALVAATRGGIIGGVYSEAIVFRLEHKSACIKQSCLTVIGHISDKVFLLHAMFVAGKMTARGDVFGQFLDRPTSPPVYFLSDDTLTGNESAIAVLEMPNGWIVIPPTK